MTRKSGATRSRARNRSSSAASVALSKDLKRRGWKFVGPTTMFALMEAMGLINNHVAGCITRDEVALARRAFTPPVSTLGS